MAEKYIKVNYVHNLAQYKKDDENTISMFINWAKKQFEIDEPVEIFKEHKDITEVFIYEVDSAFTDIPYTLDISFLNADKKAVAHFHKENCYAPVDCCAVSK